MGRARRACGLEPRKPNPWAPWVLAGALLSLALSASPIAWADDDAPQNLAIHVQSTVVDQGHLAFNAPYSGPQSLSPYADGRETFDATAYLGARLWRGAEAWIDPEVDQGFGLNNTLGLAGFPSAEAYKVGSSPPYFRLQRAFIRQTIDLGGTASRVGPDINVLGGSQGANRIVITAGKLSVTDIFDTNDFAHDPRHDFLNWTVVDAGSFDYAADAWGYTVGGAVEWYQGPWTLRSGIFDLSVVPNSESLDRHFGQFQFVEEIERRYTIAGEAGALKVTGFLTRGRMATYADAIALAAITGGPANVALVRDYRSRSGISFDLQQQVTGALGVFLRGGLAGGNVEPYEFTDVDRSISGGLSLKGKAWGRPSDTIGLAGVINAISRQHQLYLADGGLGILVGDGQLPHPGPEDILETYYDIPLGKYLHLAADYQFVNNPGYNRDRGPVHIFAGRIHAQF